MIDGFSVVRDILADGDKQLFKEIGICVIGCPIGLEMHFAWSVLKPWLADVYH